MRFIPVVFAVLVLLCSHSFAEFSISPYLYPGETASSVTIASFAAANGTAKLFKVNGSETFLVLNDQIVTDKAQIGSLLTKYYADTYYLSAESHNRWRNGVPYDEFPMRVCVSIQSCSAARSIGAP